MPSWSAVSNGLTSVAVGALLREDELRLVVAERHQHAIHSRVQGEALRVPARSLLDLRLTHHALSARIWRKALQGIAGASSPARYISALRGYERKSRLAAAPESQPSIPPAAGSLRAQNRGGGCRCREGVDPRRQKASLTG
jgi:hypothetical protein